MAGEINGTKAIISKGAGAGAELVGQMEFTMAEVGAPIPISNKSFGDNVVYLDGELSGKQKTLTGTLTYNTDTVYQQMRVDADSGTQDDYTVTYSDGTAYTAKFVPTAMSDSFPHGGHIATSITLLSSGAVTPTRFTV